MHFLYDLTLYVNLYLFFPLLLCANLQITLKYNFEQKKHNVLYINKLYEDQMDLYL